ncbi:hypothetical protein DH2020_029567 [Rehmannia glutinosa]|uniref:Uncharacterized protein n=1 Tax=Rehmannia glutinosa TaxID=99300 RepID=A0ABR0VRL7_REHGL
MSVFKLPVSTCNELNKLAACFWWGDKNGEAKKIHLKAWNTLTIPKNQGGLGFHELQTFNDALITKQLWRIITKPNLLVSKFLKAKYFPDGGLLDVKISQSVSWLWRCWMAARTFLRRGLRYEVCNGKSIRIWQSPWIINSDFFLPMSSSPSHISPIWVNELLQPDGKHWNAPLISETFHPIDAQNIMNLSIHSNLSKDSLVWHFGKKGLFSVKSTYSKLILDNFKLKFPAESSISSSRNSIVWVKSWKL